MTALKPGYKQTEVGVIPEDWTVARLGAIASVTFRFDGRAVKMRSRDSSPSVMSVEHLRK